MKIGFIGAGGTGKSTVAKLLSEKIGLPLMQSPSRACFEKRGVKTEDEQNKMSAEDRLLLQMDIFEAITKQCETNKEGIFERTNLDNLFYMLFRCHDIITRKETEDAMVTTFRMLATFDYLFYFPIYDWIDKEGDGMRTQSYAAKILFEGWTAAFLKNYGLIARHIGDQPPEDRVLQIMSRMGIRQ